MIQRIQIDQEGDRDAWLAMRKQDVTASVIGALFGLSPHTTAAELYWRQKGIELPRDFDQDMLDWREDLEAVFPKRVKRIKPEWTLTKASEYLRDPDARIGCTPDFYVTGDPRGLGILQAKTSDRRTFERDWSEGRPPAWIELQNATELMLETKAAWGAVAVITVESFKSRTEIFDIPRHAGVEAKLRDAVARFWRAVEWEEEPQLDYARDAALIAALFPPEKSRPVEVDLSGDNELPVLLAERADLKARIKPMEDRCDEIGNELKAKMGDAEIARIGEFRAAWSPTNYKAQPAKPARVGSRRLLITDFRKPQEIVDDGKPIRF